MNPYAVCDTCGSTFEPQLQDSEGDMFFTCPHCGTIYRLMLGDITACQWCGKVVDRVALEVEDKSYCSKKCYDDETEWYVSNGEIRE